jgi:hypothetical protein
MAMARFPGVRANYIYDDYIIQLASSKAPSELTCLVLQDPSLRPSAKALLQHPFLAGPHDSGKVAELVQRHSDKRRNANQFGGRTSQAADGLLDCDGEASKWDFGTVQERVAINDPSGKGSLRSHQINSFTIRDSTWGNTFAQRQLHPGVTLSQHQSLFRLQKGNEILVIFSCCTDQPKKYLNFSSSFPIFS